MQPLTANVLLCTPRGPRLKLGPLAMRNCDSLALTRFAVTNAELAARRGTCWRIIHSTWRLPNPTDHSRAHGRNANHAAKCGNFGWKSIDRQRHPASVLAMNHPGSRITSEPGAPMVDNIPGTRSALRERGALGMEDAGHRRVLVSIRLAGCWAERRAFDGLRHCSLRPRRSTAQPRPRLESAVSTRWAGFLLRSWVVALSWILHGRIYLPRRQCESCEVPHAQPHAPATGRADVASAAQEGVPVAIGWRTLTRLPPVPGGSGLSSAAATIPEAAWTSR
jgi:hypothetical protein